MSMFERSVFWKVVIWEGLRDAGAFSGVVERRLPVLVRVVDGDLFFLEGLVAEDMGGGGIMTGMGLYGRHCGAEAVTPVESTSAPQVSRKAIRA